MRTWSSLRLSCIIAPGPSSASGRLRHAQVATATPFPSWLFSRGEWKRAILGFREWRWPRSIWTYFRTRAAQANASIARTSPSLCRSYGWCSPSSPTSIAIYQRWRAPGLWHSGSVAPVSASNWSWSTSAPRPQRLTWSASSSIFQVYRVYKASEERLQTWSRLWTIIGSKQTAIGLCWTNRWCGARRNNTTSWRCRGLVRIFLCRWSAVI